MEVTGMKCLKIINLFTMVGEKFENYWSEMSKYNQLSPMVRVRFENYLAEMSKNYQFIHHGVYCHRWDDLFTGVVGTICLLALLGRFVY